MILFAAVTLSLIEIPLTLVSLVTVRLLVLIVLVVTPDATKSPTEEIPSRTFVPSEYNNFLPLSVAEKVTPVPELVLTVTVKAPVMYNISFFY